MLLIINKDKLIFASFQHLKNNNLIISIVFHTQEKKVRYMDLLDSSRSLNRKRDFFDGLDKNYDSLVTRQIITVYYNTKHAIRWLMFSDKHSNIIMCFFIIITVLNSYGCPN